MGHDGRVRVRIDRKGRVLIPAAVRQRLSLVPGMQVRVEVDAEAIRLTPMREGRREIVEIDGWPVVAPVPGTTVTDEDIRRWRLVDQR